MKKNKMNEKFLMIRRKMKCLKLAWKEVKRQHLEVLIQRNIKTCLTIFSSLQSTFSSRSLCKAVFSRPSRPPPPSSPQAAASSNSTTLSASQASWYNSVWASMHGSKLLLDRRLREGGTEPERNLITIREDLGLLSETGNMIDIQVFHWRLDRRTRVEVVEQVKRNMGEFFRI